MDEYVVDIAPDKRKLKGIRVKAKSFDDAFKKIVGDYKYKEVDETYPLPDAIIIKDEEVKYYVIPWG